MIIGFPIKKNTNTRLEELEEKVSLLTGKLEKLTDAYFSNAAILEKVVNDNTNKVNIISEIVCNIFERIENLECRVDEFDISDGNESIIYSIMAKLEYIIKKLEE